MSNSPKGCPICSCTEYGFASFPVCWLCGYAQERDGRVVHPCGKSEEVVATLRAKLAERDALLKRVSTAFEHLREDRFGCLFCAFQKKFQGTAYCVLLDMRKLDRQLWGYIEPKDCPLLILCTELNALEEHQ